MSEEENNTLEVLSCLLGALPENEIVQHLMNYACQVAQLKVNLLLNDAVLIENIYAFKDTCPDFALPNDRQGDSRITQR